MTDPLCSKGCGRVATYDCPEDLCEEHWIEWWVAGMQPKNDQEREALIQEVRDVIRLSTS